MPDPRVLPDVPTAPPPRPSRFGALWRYFLPVAIAMVGAAVLTGIFDTTGRPAWLFAGGVAIALIGVASLLRWLVDQGRADLRAAEKRLAERFPSAPRKDIR